MSNRRWLQRPEGANWGDFGPDDNLGTLNYLTPETVRAAAQEIRQGLVFCLSLPLNLPGGNILNPRRHPPVLHPTMRGGVPNFNYREEQEEPGATDVISDDYVVLYNQYSTQWDGLGHCGWIFDCTGSGTAEIAYYNGFRAGKDVVLETHDDGTYTSSTGPLGIDRMAIMGVQGRGVMIDLAHHFGPGRRVVRFEDIQRVLEADAIHIRRGDMICLHTGYGGMLVDMGGDPDLDHLTKNAIELDGRDPDLLAWLTESGISALIADNYAVESFPATPASLPCACAPLHEHCLFKLGMPLGELWLLSELAAWLRANSRSSFFLTAPPLRLPGAAGSPLTPIATV